MQQTKKNIFDQAEPIVKPYPLFSGSINTHAKHDQSFQFIHCIIYYLSEDTVKMKVSFYQLFFVLFLFFLNDCQCRDDSSSSNEDQDEVYRKLFKATNRTLQSILPPTCYQIILNQSNVQDQYISRKGLTGRVLPLGTFETTILALEYLYGIVCPIPGFPPRPINLQSIPLISVAYDKKYLITRSEFMFQYVEGLKLTFFVAAAFDKDYKLCGYDGQVRNPGITLDARTPQERQGNIARICSVAEQFCTGPLKEYANITDCIQFLTNNVPYGSWDRGDQGSVNCRIIHTSLVPLLPEIHCPHVGPTGGGKCVDKTFDYYYNRPSFLACAHKYN